MFFQSETRRLKSAIAAQDSGLGQSLTDLAKALGLDGAGVVAANVGNKAIGIARSHPVPVALAGAGLAWLIMRPLGGTSAPAMETLSRWEDEGGQVLKPGAVADSVEDTGREWLEAARNAKSAARDRLLDLYDRGIATAEAKATIAAEQAEALTLAFRNNVGHLGAEAADRTAEARRRTWEALEKGGKLAERGMDQGRQIAKDHPVATSVAGLAVGAGLLALALRGRGLMRLLAPVALSAALAEAATRLRRSPAEKVEDAAEDVASAAKTTARRTTPAAKSAVKEADAVMTGAVRGAKAKVKSAAKPAAKAATTAARKTRASAKATVAKAATKASDVAKAIEDEVPNGAAKH
jgi:hypothetical protein